MRIIYGICDDDNSIIYVGAARSVEKRIKKHWILRGKLTSPISKWLAALEVIPSWIVLEENVPDTTYAERETWWIQHFGLNTLFNTKLGGDRFDDQTYQLTPEQRENQRAAVTRVNIGRPVSDETRAKISKANTGRKRSAVARAKMSIAKRGRRLTSEHRVNIASGLVGHVVSKQTREKISASQRGKPRSEQNRRGLQHAWNEASRDPMLCNDCGKICRGPRGLAIHQGQMHK